MARIELVQVCRKCRLSVMLSNRWVKFSVVDARAITDTLKDILGLLLVIGLGLPVLLAQPDRVYSADPLAYSIDALELLQGNIPIGAPRRLGFPLLITIAFRLGGVSIPSAVWVTKVLGGALNLIVIYLLGKRLYGRAAGLIGAAFIAGTIELMLLSTQVMVDPVFAFWVNASIWLLVAGFQDQKSCLFFLSGLCLGVAFVTKESAIVWTVLPMIFFLVTPDNWTERNMEGVLSFVFSFMLIAVSWGVVVYRDTGRLVLLYIVNKYSWGGAFRTVFVVAVICLAGAWVKRKAVTGILERLMRKFPSWTLTANGYVLWGLSILLFTVVVVQGTQWSGEGYLTATVKFLQHLDRSLELFKYIPVSVLIVIGLALFRQKHKREETFGLLVLTSCLPLLTVVSVSNDLHWEIRQLYVFFSMAFLLVGHAAVFLISAAFDFLRATAGRRSFVKAYLPVLQMVNIAIIIIVSVHFGLSRGLTFMRERNSHGPQYYLSGNSLITPGAVEFASWMEQNIPVGSGILFGGSYIQSEYFLTEGRYKFRSIPRDSTNELVMTSEGLKWNSWGREARELPPVFRNALYLSTNVPDWAMVADRYTILNKDGLKAGLQEQEVDYVIIMEQDVLRHRSNFRYIPPLFGDSVLFEKLFDTRIEPYRFHVFKVRQDQLQEFQVDTPLLMLRDVWSELMGDAAIVSEYASDAEYQLLRALGEQEVRFVDETEQDGVTYSRWGDLYAQHGSSDPAARMYRAALVVNPGLADSFIETMKTRLPEYRLASNSPLVFCTREEMTYDHTPPGSPVGYLVVMGDALRISGRMEKARGAYQQAIMLCKSDLAESASDCAEDLLAAAHMGMGEIWLVSGEIEKALHEFQRAAELSPEVSIREKILAVQSALYQARGETELAWAAQLQAGSVSNVFPDRGIHLFNSRWPEHQVIDLLQEEPLSISTGSGNPGSESSVRPGVFNITDDPRRVLFVHPPARIQYRVRVPANAELRFSPALSPEVWQHEGDGVQFTVRLEEPTRTIRAFDKYIDPKNNPADRRWHNERVDLSRWAGQTVTLTFITDPGPAGDAQYDWAGWGEPRIVQPAYYGLINQFVEAQVSDSLDRVRLDWMLINDDLRGVIFQHPTTVIAYALHVEPASSLCFGLGMDPAVWSLEGDGMQFDISVYDGNIEHIMFSRYVDPRHNPDDRQWIDECVELDQFGDQDVTLSLSTLPGPAGDDRYDWGGWSNPVLLNEARD